MLLYERNGRPGAEINTQCKDKRNEKLKRCAKQKKGGPGREEGEKEGGKRGGGKKKGAYVALLTRNTDEAPQFRDASRVVSLWMSNYPDTTTGNMRQSVKGGEGGRIINSHPLGRRGEQR